MTIERQKLYVGAENFFDLDGSAAMKLDRAAALDVCLVAATKGFLLVKVEGGIWHNGLFEARLDAIWDGLDPPLERSMAEQNNTSAANFIRSKPLEYHAFIVTSAPLSGYAHRRADRASLKEKLVAKT